MGEWSSQAQPVQSEQGSEWIGKAKAGPLDRRVTALLPLTGRPCAHSLVSAKGSLSAGEQGTERTGGTLGSL